MSNYYQFEPQDEFFELSLNTDESRISSKDLRSYLLQLEKLVDSINQTLKLNYGNECYDVISIDVLAFESGSFKIPLSIKKLFDSENLKRLKDLTENPTAARIIGGIILGLLMSGSPKEIDSDIYEDSGIKQEQFLENINTAKAIKEISELTIGNDSIRDLTVTFEIANGENRTINISKSCLQDTIHYMEKLIENNKSHELINNELVEIISLDFSMNNSIWKFYYNSSIIEAKMLDSEFLEKTNKRYCSFRKGDKLNVNMVIMRSGKDVEYLITKVNSHIVYSSLSEVG